MTVAALLDVGVGAGANLGAGAGVVSGAGAGSGAGASGPTALRAGLGFGTRAGGPGAGTGEVEASGPRTGGALSATGAEQGAKSSGIASNSPNQVVATNGSFRAQWRLAVSEQSRGAETFAEEESAAAPKFADQAQTQSIAANVVDAPPSRPNGATNNVVAVNAAGQMQPRAQQSATRSEVVTAAAVPGSKTRDEIAARSAERKLPVKDAVAQATAGDPAALAMAAMEPAPMVAAMESAQELPSSSGGALPVAPLHAAAADFTHTGDTTGDATNATPLAFATHFPLSSDSAEARTGAVPHAAPRHSAPPESSLEPAASEGTRASIETSVEQQSEPGLPAAGIASNPVSSSPAYASSQNSAAALPDAQTPGLPSGIRGRAAVQGRDALTAVATTESENASGGEGSKLDVSGFDATPGRQKNAGTASVSAASVPAAIVHSAQAVNPVGDPSALIRVTSSGEGSAMVAGSHMAAGGGATGQTLTGSAGGTFAALDSGSTFGADTSVGAPGWVHASSQRAEAGFEDPVLGWVGVRADVVSGTVHAAILPGSAEAAAALSTHLAGLGTYLSEQHAPVSAVTVAAPAQQGMESGGGQHLQQNPQQNGGEDNRGAREALQQAGGTAVSTASWSGPADIGGMVPMDSPGGLRGANISVMV
jgi:hypothetical protein